MQLNAEQEQVAGQLTGRILTIAGPGSGKTKTLTERTGRLIHKGIEPASILCLTFTNKARDEMRHRLAAALGEKAQDVFISNFHGLCGMVLRQFGRPLGYTERMTVCDSDDQIDLILQIARMRGMEPTKPQGRMLATIANDWRENVGTPADLEALVRKKTIHVGELAVMRRYFEVIRSKNQCDFSALLSETVRLLREHPDVLGKLQLRFRHIQVDEFQDTNRAQHELVELLSGVEDNVLAVGDGDQSIYEWRGASPDGMDRFIRNGQRKHGCRVVKLGTNYRSTPEIVATADRLIRHCANRIAVEFKPVRASGEPPKLAKFEDPQVEADALALSIQNTMRSGTQMREIAVFYRTNDMSRQIEQALARRQIPYVVIGGGSYYDRMEVRDVLSMLRFLCNPKDGISLARIANKPARGLGDAVVGKLEYFAEQRQIDLMEAMERAVEVRDEEGRPLSDAGLRACQEGLRVFGINVDGRTVADITRDILARTRYDEWLKERYEEKGDYEDRKRNVDELVSSIEQFCWSNRHATLSEYLESISLFADSNKDKNDDAVRLMSLHASKGLEFDVVYLIGAEHGVLPHDKAVEDRGERGLDEERRLCYVGFTRARKLLRVTWCERRVELAGGGTRARFRKSRPSRFLVEAGLMSRDEYRTFGGQA